MTRDQAIEKLAHTRMHMLGERRAFAWIEVFEVLGMLKLDEPKSAEDKLIKNLLARGFCAHDADVVRQALDYCDLNVVEKRP